MWPFNTKVTTSIEDLLLNEKQLNGQYLNKYCFDGTNIVVYTNIIIHSNNICVTYYNHTTPKHVRYINTILSFKNKYGAEFMKTHRDNFLSLVSMLDTMGISVSTLNIKLM